jgi:hypothetical protein
MSVLRLVKKSLESGGSDERGNREQLAQLLQILENIGEKIDNGGNVKDHLNDLRKIHLNLGNFNSGEAISAKRMIESLLRNDSNIEASFNDNNLTYIDKNNDHKYKRMVGHNDVQEQIKQELLSPIIRGSAISSNFMLLYSIAGNGQEQLLVDAAMRFKHLQKSKGVEIVKLNYHNFKQTMSNQSLWELFYDLQERSKRNLSKVSPLHAKSVRTILIMNDIDRMDANILDDMLSISKSDLFPHVLVFCSTSAPQKLSTSLRQRFFPSIYVSLLQPDGVKDILLNKINETMNRKSHETILNETENRNVLGNSSSSSNDLRNKMNEFIVMLTKTVLCLKFANAKIARDEIKTAVDAKFPNSKITPGQLNDIVRLLRFSQDARFKFGYSYEDIENIANMILAKFTKEINSVQGSDENCVYSPDDNNPFCGDGNSTSENISLSGSWQQKLQIANDLLERLKKESGFDGSSSSSAPEKPENKEESNSGEDVGGDSETSKQEKEQKRKRNEAARAKEKFDAQVTKEEGDEINKLENEIRNATEGSSEKIKLRLKMQILQEQISNRVNDLDYYRDEHKNPSYYEYTGNGSIINCKKLSQDCNKAIPSASWSRFKNVQSSAIKAWITDVVKSSVSTIDPEAFVELVHFEASISPESKKLKEDDDDSDTEDTKK